MLQNASLHVNLLDWFAENRQQFPWRTQRDPYRVWLSEIMLQQTQVNTVVPYFERFLERFPDIQSLAQSSLEDVLKLWEGLGYYSRARNLHRAAQIVVEKHEGSLPRTLESLRKLPGVGPYTAGAIASIAFGVDAPVLDGNVIRVLTRLYDIDENIDQASVQKKLWKFANDLLPPGRSGLWNEALMDFGRLMCLPATPLCQECPLTGMCAAYANGTQHLRPVKNARLPLPHYDVAAGVIVGSDGRLLITRRPLDGLLGGMWEFPGGKRHLAETLEECLAREIEEELGIQITVQGMITHIQHSYTHFKITLYAYWCAYQGGEPRMIGCIDWAWVSVDELDRYAFPVADKKILQLLKHPRNRQLSLL
jgi:A/G-specific adenine glycosylase